MGLRAVLAVLVLGCAVAHADPASEYEALLGRVVKDGAVDYAQLRERRAVLDAYVASLEKAGPGGEHYSQVAFWINAYNALTLQRVLDTREPGDLAYKVVDVPRFWKEERWTVAGRRVSLDGIEKGILLKELAEPGIHFAVNCASVTCPPLQPRLWRAERLPEDLVQAARAYLADKRYNEFDHVELIGELSQLFEWYRDDFRADREGAKVSPFQLWLADHAPRETVARVLREVDWTFLFKPWDWTLNDRAVAQAAARDRRGEVGWLWMLIYFLATLGLLAYGVHAFKMLWWRRRHGERYREQLRAVREASPLGRTVFPHVLVQLPVFNEGGVVERVIDAVAALRWPRDRLGIQVLDDSTDETLGLVDRAVARHGAAGVPIEVVRRPHRAGFKAGALAAGLTRSEAEFVAIFDADFVPEPDFLERTLPLFDVGSDVACVQGRWGHLNRNQSLLTRAQAIGIDAHFFVQQLARAAAGKFLNFNGTAGVWRTSAVADAGGWCGDTLTEDLDLSYRAQLRGWRIVFDPAVRVRAELPPTLAGFKTQQQRWACGSTQCARKYLGVVWRAKLPLAVKAEATMHLCAYSVCLAMTALVLLLPFGVGHLPNLLRDPAWWPLWTGLWIAALGPVTAYVAGQVARGRVPPLDILACFLLGLGACVNNSVAVLRGLVRPIRTFVRTPKQGAARRALRTTLPVTEQLMVVFTLASALHLLGSRPWAVATYAFFCCSGFWVLAGWWWLVERRRCRA